MRRILPFEMLGKEWLIVDRSTSMLVGKKRRSTPSTRLQRNRREEDLDGVEIKWITIASFPGVPFERKVIAGERNEEEILYCR